MVAYLPEGPLREQGAWSVQREHRRNRGKIQYRLVRHTKGGHTMTLVLDIEELFDLTDLLDDACDESEGSEDE